MLESLPILFVNTYNTPGCQNSKCLNRRLDRAVSLVVWPQCLRWAKWPAITTSIRGSQGQFMLLSACTANSAKCFVRLLPQWTPATIVHFCCKACYKIVSFQRSFSCWVELRRKVLSFDTWWPKKIRFRNFVVVTSVLDTACSTIPVSYGTLYFFLFCRLTHA